MSAIKILGSILALAAGVLILIEVLLNIPGTIHPQPEAEHIVQWTTNLSIAIVGIFGGLIGIKGKILGGIFVEIAGTLSLILGLIFWTDVVQFHMFAQYSLLDKALGPIPYITLEPIIMLIGGVLILLSKFFFKKG